MTEKPATEVLQVLADLDKDMQRLLDQSLIKLIRLDQVKIDTSYQRQRSPSLVDRIAEKWNPVATGIIIVSERGRRSNPEESGMFLVDGQHRVLAARKRNIAELDARLVNLRKEADPGKVEAMLRLTTNVGLTDNAGERFKAQIRAGYEESRQIEKIIVRNGTHVSYIPTQEEGIQAIASVETIYRYDDTGGLLDETLKMIKDGFGQFYEKTRSASMLKGMAWFVAAHSEDVMRDEMIRRLQSVNGEVIDRRARSAMSTQGRTLWFNYYVALLDVYNEKRRDANKLPIVTRGALKLSREGGIRTVVSGSTRLRGV